MMSSRIQREGGRGEDSVLGSGDLAPDSVVSRGHRGPLVHHPKVRSHRLGRVALGFGALVLLLVAVGSGVRAHDVDFSAFRGAFRPDGVCRFETTYDCDAFLVEAPPGHSGEEVERALAEMTDASWEQRFEALQRMFAVRVSLRFDGEIVRHAVSFPDAADRSLGDVVRLEGEVPEDARSFVFWASRGLGTVTLELVRDGESPWVQVLQPGERSEPYALMGPAVQRSVARVLLDYLVLGFEHILPKGLDHILFILGLFLLSARVKPLLWQVTAFTLAHSVTLALSMYGVASFSSSVVEPLIALSIAYVAIENLLTSKLTPWRPTIVFFFGLLHGLGFAGVLKELGLPSESHLIALIGFNGGVELGQLAVVAGGFLTVGWWRNRSWYRKGVVFPASVAIAAVGLFWTYERIFL